MKRSLFTRKTWLFVALCALVAGAPAIARAVQPEPEPRDHAARAERTGEPNEEGGEHSKKEASPEDEGENRPIPAINLWDFSNKEQPPYGVMVLNFLALMTMYYAFGKKPVAEGLKARRVAIAKEIEDAQKMRAEAETRAVKYQEKLKNLEAELKETRESLLASGQAERERIVKEAEEKALRLEKDAKFLVEQETKQMRVELLKEAVEMASLAAEELLKKRITAADQERLAEDYLSELGGKRAGTTSMAPGSIAPASLPGGAE